MESGEVVIQREVKRNNDEGKLWTENGYTTYTVKGSDFIAMVSNAMKEHYRTYGKHGRVVKAEVLYLGSADGAC